MRNLSDDDKAVLRFVMQTYGHGENRAWDMVKVGELSLTHFSSKYKRLYVRMWDAPHGDLNFLTNLLRLDLGIRKPPKNRGPQPRRKWPLV